MAANSKPRKKYKPKGTSTNVLSDIFGGMSGDHMTHLRTLQIRNHKALADMVHGSGSREQWDELRGMINMACVMCDQGIGSEFSPIMVAGKDALMEVGKRLAKLGRVVLKGDELTALREALEHHDAQLENIRAVDVERAYLEVKRRVKARVNTTSVEAELRAERMAA